MATDFTGKEIKVGDYVRHAYEPGNEGTHLHYFSAIGEVLEITGRAAVVRGAGASKIPVYLCSLLQVVPKDLDRSTPYLVPLSSKAPVEISTSDPDPFQTEWDDYVFEEDAA